ncbi:MAG: P-II family nitrogen regulator [Bacteroidales bacterium]|nr:P-II family nitrogen regulator [Bacteroidales bacterium]MCF8351809.1 P-II family nitrogen regulator [Bacteroidales bacterium]MCF8377109.1 P-II family nitrogen regulator [Bacteroidales bacterium]MCF8402090.1 P-II family nitrogen regulator [Bacteroidales bacterium]
MKLIKAYIRKRKIEDVYKALNKEGYCCMTFVECEGTGRYSDKETEHISEKYPFAQAYPVVKLEILVADEHVAEVIKIIRQSGRTGYKGDGMIIVSPVESAFKVRTDEEGILAI